MIDQIINTSSKEAMILSILNHEDTNILYGDHFRFTNPTIMGELGYHISDIVLILHSDNKLYTSGSFDVLLKKNIKDGERLKCCGEIDIDQNNQIKESLYNMIMMRELV